MRPPCLSPRIAFYLHLEPRWEDGRGVRHPKKTIDRVGLTLLKSDASFRHCSGLREIRHSEQSISTQRRSVRSGPAAEIDRYGYRRITQFPSGIHRWHPTRRSVDLEMNLLVAVCGSNHKIASGGEILDQPARNP